MRVVGMIAVALAVAAAGCSRKPPAYAPAMDSTGSDTAAVDTVPSEAAAPEAPAPGTPQAELAAARRQWREKGPRDYRYVYQAVCMCYIRDKVRVTVENGRVTAARKVSDDDWMPETFWVAFPTVDRLFAQIEEALRGGTPVEARYDPALGYPVDVTIGTLADDAGVRHTLRALEPLP